MIGLLTLAQYAIVFSVSGEKGTTLFGKYGKGDFFIGKPNPEKMSELQKFKVGYKNRGFYGATDMTPLQKKTYDIIETHLQKTGTFSQDAVNYDKAISGMVKAQQKVDYAYINQFPLSAAPTAILEEERTAILEAVAKQQQGVEFLGNKAQKIGIQTRKLDAMKGSATTSMMVTTNEQKNPLITTYMAVEKRSDVGKIITEGKKTLGDRSVITYRTPSEAIKHGEAIIEVRIKPKSIKKGIISSGEEYLIPSKKIHSIKQYEYQPSSFQFTKKTPGDWDFQEMNGMGVLAAKELSETRLPTGPFAMFEKKEIAVKDALKSLAEKSGMNKLDVGTTIHQYEMARTSELIPQQSDRKSVV